MWPTYRNRYLPAFSRAALQALPAKDRALVIIPTGAVEQHGPHLPVGVDAILGQAYLDVALPLLPAEAPVYVAPPIQVGKSNEHDGFPGTLIHSREILRQQFLAIAHQLATWGFSRIRVLNTHGGNVSVIKSVLREVHRRHAMDVALLSFAVEMDLPPREKQFGIHANETETALMREAMPERIDDEFIPTWWFGSLDDGKTLQAEFAPATYAWKTLDISRSGVMGDAKRGTAEKGKRWLKALGQALADELQRQLQN